MGRPHRDLLVDTLVYGIAGSFATIVANEARLIPHRSWGTIAAWGFAVATVASAAGIRSSWSARQRRRARAVLLGGVILATVAAPTVWLSIDRLGRPEGTAQSEVIVIEAMARRMTDSGTPYLDRDEIRVEAARPRVGFRAYSPYQPAMAAFGVPRALWWSWLTDARLVFVAATLAIGVAIIRTTTLDPVRTAQMLAVIPPTGLAIATGGDDLPVLALCCWALALAHRRRFTPAALAAGVALALKLTAAPVALAVIAVAGVSRARRVAPLALGLPALTLIPALLVKPAAVIENLVRYPAGLAERRTTAKSPLPGVMIAEQIPGGRVAVALAMVAIGAWFVSRLWRNPPDDAASAARLLAATTAAAILVAPQARFGYLMYPITFAVLGGMMGGGGTTNGSDGDGDPDVLRGDGRRSVGLAETGPGERPLAGRLRTS